MKKVIITGSCGFIGTCLAERLMREGIAVVGIDNLSRRGSEFNAVSLMQSKLFKIHRVDLSHTPKAYDVFSQIGSVDAVFHLAAQVAVTTSYSSKQADFFDNALASFNVIDAVSKYSPEAYCFYASTNKVYGHIEVNKPVGLDYPLKPYTPYGVSKATGELYFTEYGTTEIGLTTCSLRQSCIYGHHQYGVEDQGWVAWFAIANILGSPITLYGDGKQVRDLLFIDDLIELYLKCWQSRLTGVYPVGGGPDNSVNIHQALDLICSITGKKFENIGYGETRPGDQPYFVADLSWTRQVNLEWRPATTVPKGTEQMIEWIGRNESGIRGILGKK